MPRRLFTVGLKLSILLTLLLSAAISSLTWLATHLFSRDSVSLIQHINADAAGALSAQLRAYFEHLSSNASLLGLVMLRNGGSRAGRDPAVQEFLSQRESLRSVFLVKHSGNETIEQAAAVAPSQPALFRSGRLRDWDAPLRRSGLSFVALEEGQAQVIGLSAEGGRDLLALAIPLVKRPTYGFSHSVVALFDARSLPDTFNDSELVRKTLLDRNGKVLLAADGGGGRRSLAHLDVVKEFLASKVGNLQRRYPRDGDGAQVLGAVRSVGFGGLAVLAEVPELRALESVRTIERRALWLGLIVLSLALMAGHWFSDSLTWPLKQLAKAADRIARGDFSVRVKPSSRDEVGALSVTFNGMARGLEERERLRDTFKKFHSEAIAERIMSGKLKLGGETLSAAVLFMDLRDFTAFSEGLEPHQVVEQLNEYLERMVTVIQRHGGIVDKYVGDAIMAAWGVPDPDPRAPSRALPACIEIRRALAELNEIRRRRRQAPLRIGMGLHYGPVTAGNIGSTNRMEYTLIGDTVNLASRVESLTKEVETDLLVTKSIREAVGKAFEFGETSLHKVKGKALPVEISTVIGPARAASTADATAVPAKAAA